MSNARTEAIDAAAQLLALSIAVSDRAYESAKTGLRTSARLALRAEGITGHALDAAVLEFLIDASEGAKRIIERAKFASAPAAGNA